MNANTKYLMAKKGQIVTMTTKRDCKVRKGQEPIQKQSTFQCRIGVSYDNISAVKDKRDTGDLPTENAGLPWGQWVEYPYLIEHKGEEYMRCTSLHNNFTPRVTYYRNGVEITVDEAKAACLASEFPKTAKDSDVFNIRVGSIVTVK